MKLVWWMLAGSVLAATVLSLIPAWNVGREIWLGMLGPLASSVVSWIAMLRQNLQRPQAMTRLLIRALVIKMAFFAAYVTAVLGWGRVQSVPFAFSFVGFYIALHAVEAAGLHRIQTARRSGETLSETH